MSDDPLREIKTPKGTLYAGFTGMWVPPKKPMPRWKRMIGRLLLLFGRKSFNAAYRVYDGHEIDPDA